MCSSRNHRHRNSIQFDRAPNPPYSNRSDNSQISRRFSFWRYVYVLEISFGLNWGLEAPSCSYSLGSVQGERPIESDIDCQLKCHKHKSRGVASILEEGGTFLEQRTREILFYVMFYVSAIFSWHFWSRGIRSILPPPPKLRRPCDKSTLKATLLLVVLKRATIRGMSRVSSFKGAI